MPPRKVVRSSVSGRFVKAAKAKISPKKTVTETIQDDNIGLNILLMRYYVDIGKELWGKTIPQKKKLLDSITKKYSKKIERVFKKN